MILRRDRRVRPACCAATALAVACAAPTLAAQTLPGPRSVTLNAALSQSEQRAPDTIVAGARYQAAGTEVPVAGMLTNPSVTAGVAFASYFYTSFVMSLPIFGQRAAAVRVAESALGEAERDVDVVRLDVRLATALAWVDLWLAEREAAAARDLQARRARLQSITEERFSTGTAPRLDVLRARAEAVRAQAEADASAQAVLGAAARLSIWLGEPLGAVPDIASQGEPPTGANVPSLAALLARLDRHPLYLRALAHRRVAEDTVTLEQRRRYPLVGIDLGGAFFGPPMAANSPIGPWTNEIVQDLHAALTVEVPVFHAHGPLIARARAQQVQASAEADAARRRLAADVASAYAALESAAVRARALNDEVLPAAIEAADLAVEAYRAGRLDVAGVLSAEQALADTRVAAQRAVADRARAVATLEHAVGGAL